MNTNTKLKQPKVFKVSFLTSTFERFGFYIFTYLLVLYVKSTYGMTDMQAFALFGVFNGLAYISPAIGGYLADNVFGIRRCILIGMFMEATGLILISRPNILFFWFGIAFLIVGEGLFKTSPTNLLARSYGEGDPRIDSGFTLYYMAMNVGGVFAAVGAGFLQQYLGWSVAFLMAGVSIYLGLGSYLLFRHAAKDVDSEPGVNKLALRKWISVMIGLVVGVAACAYLINHLLIAHGFFFTATFLLFAYFVFEILRSPKEDKFRIIACILLIFIGMAFYVLYFQAFTSMTLFIKRSVVRTVFGFHLPSLVFLSLDPIWILVLGPIMAFIYNYLGRKNKDLAISTKFAVGLLITSLCFFILKISTFFGNANGMVSSTWIVFAFFMYALGELLVGALGVAVVTHIAPKRMYGFMMGAWYLVAMGLAGSLSGSIAGLSSVPKNITNSFTILNIYGKAFFDIGMIGLAITILAFMISPYIKKITNFDAADKDAVVEESQLLVEEELEGV